MKFDNPDFKEIVLNELEANKGQAFDIEKFEQFIKANHPQFEENWYELFDSIPFMTVEEILSKPQIDKRVKHEVQDRELIFNGKLVFSVDDVYDNYLEIDKNGVQINVVSNEDVANMVNEAFEYL